MAGHVQLKFVMTEWSKTQMQCSNNTGANFRALSHGRDASPEEIRRVQLNRHGFEDIRTKGELLPEVR